MTMSMAMMDDALWKAVSLQRCTVRNCMTSRHGLGSLDLYIGQLALGTCAVPVLPKVTLPVPLVPAVFSTVCRQFFACAPAWSIRTISKPFLNLGIPLAEKKNAHSYRSAVQAPTGRNTLQRNGFVTGVSQLLVQIQDVLLDAI